MELNWGAAIIGVLSLILLMIPFFFDYKKRKKKENNLLQSLKTVAAQQNGQIDDYEICENLIIGIDRTKNNVFFYTKEKNNEISHCIDIADIQSCKVVTSHKTLTNAKGNYKIIDKLELSFIPLSQSKIEQLIEFFNMNNSHRLNGEIPFVNKWCTIINNQLNNQNQLAGRV